MHRRSDFTFLLSKNLLILIKIRVIIVLLQDKMTSFVVDFDEGTRLDKDFGVSSLVSTVTFFYFFFFDLLTNTCVI